jgi:branched-chain amino acid transport system permease protein
MIRFLDAVIRGIQTGSVYAIVGLGINIIFGATGVFNFAQGEMVMVGAMLGVALWVGSGWPLLLALLAVIIVTAGIGAGTELVAVRGTARNKQATLWMLSTLGVAIIVRSTTTLLAVRESSDNGTRNFPAYLPWKHPIRLDHGKLLIVPQRAILVLFAILVTLLVWALFQRTLWGRALSAMAFDREGAAMRGMPVGWLAVLAFALGGAVAGFGGFVGGPITGASVTLGFGLTLKAFIASTIGGIPELWGPLIGGVILGVAEQFTVTYLDASLTSAVALGLLLVVLLVRPHGLIGRQIRTL